MDIGVFMFVTDYSTRIDDLAMAVEARGFESLFIPEHTHIPANRNSPWPGGGDLPKEYWHTLDPFPALAAAAAVTKRIRLGTGICLLTERDPILTAKEAATVDLISDGRFELAIGAGWNAEEMEHHGTDFKQRFKVMSERARAIKKIWTEDEPSFQGEFVNFGPIWSYPKPVQKPHVPILVGGETKHTMRRVAEYGSGWFPRARSFDPKVGLREMREIAAEAGRDMSTISVTLFGGKADRAALDEYEEAGVTRVLLGLPPESRETVFPLLDKYARLLK
ncbi:MAG: LLM class F420-dependent oxidoreductase [Gammaproteobacteria bacterium]|nr:LLM class F420-dependent oxidoreductase [Gammaproteobacteria bacterium]